MKRCITDNLILQILNMYQMPNRYKVSIQRDRKEDISKNVIVDAIFGKTLTEEELEEERLTKEEEMHMLNMMLKIILL